MSDFKFGDLSERLQDSVRDCLNNVNTDFLSSKEFKDSTCRFVDQQFHAVGGMKQIFKVTDSHTSREVALAKLRQSGLRDNKMVNGFIREARLTAALEHPNIVPIYDIGFNEYDQPYFTMKFLKDQSLQKILKELLKQNPIYTRKYTLNNRLDIFLKVCDAVLFAHSRHIVHLDIKPHNIMIGDYGEVYLCDWGLAKVLGENGGEEKELFLDPVVYNSLTLKGQVKGTPGFMAPEQIDGKHGDKDQVTDIYALGALLYTLLSLKAPFADVAPDQILSSSLHDEPEDINEISFSQVSHGLIAICKKAMAKKREERYQDVQLLVNDLRSYLSGFAPKAANADLLVILRLFYQRNRFRMNLFISALVILMVFGFVAVSRINSSKNKAVLSRQQAVVAESKAKLAEKNALEHLTKLRKKQREMKEISRFAAVELTNEAWKDYLSRDFKSAYSKVNSSLSLFEDDPRAWDLKGQLEFTVLNIDEAIVAFKKSRSLYSGLNRGVLKMYVAMCEELQKTVVISGEEVDISAILRIMDKYGMKNYRAMYYFLPLRLRNNNRTNQ